MCQGCVRASTDNPRCAGSTAHTCPSARRADTLWCFGSGERRLNGAVVPRSIDFMPALHPALAPEPQTRRGGGLVWDLGATSVGWLERGDIARRDARGSTGREGMRENPLALQSINSRRAPTRTSWPLRRGSLLRTVAVEASIEAARRCASVAERQWWQRRRERLLGHAERPTHAIEEVRAPLAGADVVS